MDEGWRERFRARYDELKRTEGLTQPKLAETLGVEQSTVSHWYTGKRSPENDEQFDALAAALRMHPAELRYGVTPMTEEVRLREEAWRRLSPANQKAMREVIRALTDPSDQRAADGTPPGDT